MNEIEKNFFGMLKALFTLFIVVPLKVLWILVSWLFGWLYDRHVIQQMDARNERSEAMRAQAAQQAEAERRSRNTLYGGPQQPNA